MGQVSYFIKLSYQFRCLAGLVKALFYTLSQLKVMEAKTFGGSPTLPVSERLRLLKFRGKL